MLRRDLSPSVSKRHKTPSNGDVGSGSKLRFLTEFWAMARKDLKSVVSFRNVSILYDLHLLVRKRLIVQRQIL